MPFFYGSIIAGILYVFVMPRLSGYAELGLMIFGVTFGYYYIFWQPQQALIKIAGIGVFIALTSIQNQQTYSFAALLINLMNDCFVDFAAQNHFNHIHGALIGQAHTTHKLGSNAHLVQHRIDLGPAILRC